MERGVTWRDELSLYVLHWKPGWLGKQSHLSAWDCVEVSDWSAFATVECGADCREIVSLRAGRQ